VAGMSSSQYHRTVLPNGLRVISEEMPEARSVSVGIFVEVGSRDEPAEFAGIAHFIEHMAFKGTTTRNPRQISTAIEATGGSLNAFTGRELTGFHASVLSSELETAIDVLSDIVVNSTFPDRELKKERDVIADELRGAQETPDDYIFELWQERLFPNHSLGRSILGTFESLKRIDRKKLVDFVHQHYHPKRIVVAAAGALDHDKFCKLIAKRMSLSSDRKPLPRSPLPKKAPLHAPLKVPHPSENAHLALGVRAYGYRDPRKVPVFVLNSVLGSGMSSRLFQEIRERRGIAYSVYSFFDSYRDSGAFGVYLATSTKKLDTARTIVLEQLDKIAVKPMPKAELVRAKTTLKGNIILALEASSSRMSRIARMELNEEEYLSIDDVAKKIDAVTPEEVRSTASALWGNATYTETQLLPTENNGKKK
jgi:predicted Zn-dependent peptidase